MSRSTENRPEKRNFLARLTPLNWVSIVLVILAVIFIVQNRGTASVDLLWLTVAAPQWLTISIVFLIGWLSGYLSSRRRNDKA